jgi:hypothetical protein
LYPEDVVMTANGKLQDPISCHCFYFVLVHMGDKG